jgi:hypothetical protein
LARCVADIDRQRSVIAELDLMGQDSTEARAVLKTLQQVQALRIHNHERIFGALIKLKATSVRGPFSLRTVDLRCLLADTRGQTSYTRKVIVAATLSTER